MASNDAEMTDKHASDGVRYHKLLSVLDRSLSSVVDTFKLDDLKEIFPDLAQEIPGKLADSHDQISSYLRNSANADFQAILMQYDMANKLAGLDRLVSDATERKVAPDAQPIPEYSPEAANRNRSVAIKRAELERLKANLALLKEENAQSIAQLNKERASLTTEQKQLEEAMALINKIAG
ncbi:hypothetical protein GQ54DRAFT_300436 [Martensiomyces pterosporus]|nr:hypothetical protein GQ54DRAFT_300436 [Martensiomyces pterosporus]